MKVGKSEYVEMKLLFIWRWRFKPKAHLGKQKAIRGVKSDESRTIFENDEIIASFLSLHSYWDNQIIKFLFHWQNVWLQLYFLMGNLIYFWITVALVKSCQKIAIFPSQSVLIHLF